MGSLAAIGLCIVVGVAILGLLPVVLGFVGQVQTVNLLAWEGSITPTSPWLLIVVPLLVFLVLASAGRPLAMRRAWPYFVGAIVSLVVVTYVVVEPAPVPTYGYYAAKIAWLWIAATIGLLALPIARLAGDLDDPAPSRRTAAVPASSWLKGSTIGRFWVGATALATTLLVVQILSPSPSPILNVNLLPWSATVPIVSGSYAPSPAAFEVALQTARRQEPAVIWEATDPVNHRLANFLLHLYPWNTGDDFLRWGYQQTGDLQSLCRLLATNPARLVVTRNGRHEAYILDGCGIQDPRVAVIP